MALNSQTNNDRLNPTRHAPMSVHSFVIYDYANVSRTKIQAGQPLTFRSDGTVEPTADNATPDCYALEAEATHSNLISTYGDWHNVVNVKVGTQATFGAYGRFVTRGTTDPYNTYQDAVATETADIRFFETGVTDQTVKAGLLCVKTVV